MVDFLKWCLNERNFSTKFFLLSNESTRVYREKLKTVSVKKWDRQRPTIHHPCLGANCKCIGRIRVSGVICVRPPPKLGKQSLFFLLFFFIFFLGYSFPQADMRLPRFWTIFFPWTSLSPLPPAHYSRRQLFYQTLLVWFLQLATKANLVVIWFLFYKSEVDQTLFWEKIKCRYMRL